MPRGAQIRKLTDQPARRGRRRGRALRRCTAAAGGGDPHLRQQSPWPRRRRRRRSARRRAPARRAGPSASTRMPPLGEASTVSGPHRRGQPRVAHLAGLAAACRRRCRAHGSSVGLTWRKARASRVRGRAASRSRSRSRRSLAARPVARVASWSAAPRASLVPRHLAAHVAHERGGPRRRGLAQRVAHGAADLRGPGRGRAGGASSWTGCAGGGTRTVAPMAVTRASNRGGRCRSSSVSPPS